MLIQWTATGEKAIDKGNVRKKHALADIGWLLGPSPKANTKIITQRALEATPVASAAPGRVQGVFLSTANKLL
jgi:hypothetical protein